MAGSGDLLILVTNDDGLHAEGLSCLRRAMAPLGRVVCVAPDREQSASSHALTLHHPLRMTAVEPDFVSVSGTPTDCVLLAVHGVLRERPDLIVSGINHGPNLGDDVNYSGTVAAAIEGRRLGIPSMAVSLGREPAADFAAAGAIAARLVGHLASRGLIGKRAAGRAAPGPPAAAGRRQCFLLNVNIPAREPSAIGGFVVTRLGRRVYRDAVVSKVDPHGRPYYWIGGETPIWEREESGHETDFAAVEAGRVSITPLRLDRTDHDELDRLASWNLAAIGR